jgi:transposase
MEKIGMIGLDLAKSSFQVHLVDNSGRCVERRTLRRDKVLAFFASQPATVVVMEACGGAHFWAREIGRLGHETKLIPAAYVKPFIKRQKNDAADAEAICEAASRPNMRFVRPKSAEEQADALAFRARDLLVRQRTQLINALRGHCAEFGFVAPTGARNVERLIAWLECEESLLPPSALLALRSLIKSLHALSGEIAAIEKEIARRAKTNEDARRLMSVPGIGPLIATAICALAPPADFFENRRHFAAWLGLAPRQNSTGGKERLGAITKAGNQTLRKLLVIGATAVMTRLDHNSALAGTWLARLAARKPRKLVAVALANKMARIVWALLARKEVYRASPIPAAA